MLGVKFICVGRMKEKHYISAMDEYIKRLGRYCSIETDELNEVKIGDSPTEGDILAAVQKESGEILKRIPAGAYVIAMCVEGNKITSEGLAQLLCDRASSGNSRLCFIIGGSRGLHKNIKDHADFRLSMSDMTFPHHLARVILAEQLYRAFTINAGAKYHK